MIALEEFLDDELPKLIRADSIDSIEAVAFIGAGISQNYGCKSWGQLANDLLQECMALKITGMNYLTVRSLQTREINNKLLITIAKDLLDKVDETAFINCVKKSLNHKDCADNEKIWLPIDSKKNSEVYKHIKECFSYFITTNADMHIDQLHTNIGENIREKDFNEQNLKRNTLYKIHGCISNPSSMIFTSEQYIRNYGINGKVGKFLHSVFNKYSAVFIGYGLAEFEVLERLLESNNNTHFIILGYFRHEENLINSYDSYFKALNVKQVVFYMDDLGYQELNDKLEKFYKKLQNRNKPLEKYLVIDQAFMEINNE